MPDATRVAETLALNNPVASLRYVTDARAKALSRLGILTVRDLIGHYPRRYLDMTQVSTVAQAAMGSSVTVVGTIDEVKVKQPRPRLNIVEVSVIDAEGGVMFASWFGQPWMARKLHRGDRVSVSGKMDFDFGFKRMKSPFVEILAEAPREGVVAPPLGRMIAMHPLTADISAAWMRRLVLTALESAGDALDPLPASLRISRGLANRDFAWRHIHFPDAQEDLEISRRRLAYEQLLMLQLYLVARRSREVGGAPALRHHLDGERFRALIANLGFPLTAGQLEAFQAIACDMEADRSMNRMLLGDVGTGKTAVAALAMAVAADSHLQAAMMAPTTVLANQYAVKLGPLFERSGIRWALLTGATPAAERAEIVANLATGNLDVLLGTHALIQDDVVFSHLGLAIIDEQHRFGVGQRAALRAKGPGCDFLVMTATPIPRSLALVRYGDLDCSYLRERPVKHAPVATELIAPANRAKAYETIRREVACGHRAYIVCPLVGVDVPAEGDDERLLMEARLDAGDDVTEQKDATQQASFLSKKVFPRLHVGLLTGRMPATQKDAVMADFKAGRIDVLVSTTVVEVGVDVPEATVMMVENADCFGLSQLHQLRGRVGRGEAPGYMFLVAKPASEAARARLDALVRTDDGYELAEYDLQLRHEGDVLGSRQSGLPDLGLVDVLHDGELIAFAHEDAQAIWQEDPGLMEPQHALLADALRRVHAEGD